jgi:hypothetical protein
MPVNVSLISGSMTSFTSRRVAARPSFLKRFVRNGLLFEWYKIALDEVKWLVLWRLISTHPSDNLASPISTYPPAKH